MHNSNMRTAVQRFARFGYAAKGVVYMLIGALAMGAAGGSGSAGDSREAMTALSDKPFGKIVLGVTALGLLAYALWRIYSGAANPEHDSAGSRVLFVGTGLINGALALEAARIAFLNRSGNTGNQAPHWTAQLMSQPLGTWLVAGVGLGIVAYGLGHLVKAVHARLDDQLRLGELAARTRVLVRRLARLGIGARGIAFCVIGFFLVKSALEHDPGEARDLGASLQAVQQQPFGKWLLVSIGAGLALYGFYNLLRAKYRAINP